MIEQHAVLRLLNENPVTETAPWIVGEPSVKELLGDPVVHAVLYRDGLSAQDLMRAIARGRGRLTGTPSASSTPIPMAPAVEPAVGPTGRRARASDAA